MSSSITTDNFLLQLFWGILISTKRTKKGLKKGTNAQKRTQKEEKENVPKKCKKKGFYQKKTQKRYFTQKVQKNELVQKMKLTPKKTTQ